MYQVLKRTGPKRFKVVNYKDIREWCTETKRFTRTYRLNMKTISYDVECSICGRLEDDCINGVKK